MLETVTGWLAWGGHKVLDVASAAANQLLVLRARMGRSVTHRLAAAGIEANLDAEDVFSGLHQMTGFLIGAIDQPCPEFRQQAPGSWLCG